MRLVISIPFLFVLSNREPIALRLWPTDLAWDVPLSIAILIGAAIAFLFGALIVWIGELTQRRRARRAETRVRLLEEQVTALQAQLKAARAQPIPQPLAQPVAVPAPAP